MLFLALAGCVAPAPRDQNRDAELQRTTEVLQPGIRGPVDADRIKTPEDPRETPVEGSVPDLALDVPRLASNIRLTRIQADNRLRQAGPAGTLAVVGFLSSPEATTEQLVHALNFLHEVDFSNLDRAQGDDARQRIAGVLGHDAAAVRHAASRALQIHGPGPARTAFLKLIGDPERRVRWSVVRRFGDNPGELTRAQIQVLLNYLMAGSHDEFSRLDENKDDSLSAQELARSTQEFRTLDKDSDGAISRDEWTNPVPSEIRADVSRLLGTLLEKRTPQRAPIMYNPWAPAADQLEAVQAWRDWANALPEPEGE